MTRNWRVTLPELNEVQISLILRELEAAYQRGYADGAQDTEVRVLAKKQWLSYDEATGEPIEAVPTAAIESKLKEYKS